MELRITHLNKLYPVIVPGQTFEACLALIFANPNYYIATLTDESVIALGIDVLKGSTITLAPVPPEDIVAN